MYGLVATNIGIYAAIRLPILESGLQQLVFLESGLSWWVTLESTV